MMALFICATSGHREEVSNKLEGLTHEHGIRGDGMGTGLRGGLSGDCTWAALDARRKVAMSHTTTQDACSSAPGKERKQVAGSR